MRAFITALVLFTVTVTAVGINTAVLAKRFEKISGYLSELPTDNQVYEQMSERERTAVEERLHDTAALWKKDAAYLCCTMRHTVCMEFDKALDAGISFYQSGAYDEYLAQITDAKLTVGHLLFDEGLSLGNIL